MPELVVASFNAHWGTGHKGHGFPPFDLADAAKRLDADVVVLQELWEPDGGPGQVEEVAEALGADAVSVALGRAEADPKPKVVGRPSSPEAGQGAWSLGMFSRLPIRASRTHWLPQLPFDPGARAVLTIDVEVEGRPLALHGVHLAHLEMGVPFHAPALRRALTPVDRSAVLVGDMNMWGWCISAMAPRGWRRQRGSRTYPAHHPLARIDHLLTTPSVEVVEAEVLPDLGSDHRPIRARLRLR
jgi:endonuclease/exonuclease/phosphatase family metal-dependent hydrolase